MQMTFVQSPPLQNLQAFTTHPCFKLNASKLEIVTQLFGSETIQINNDVHVDISCSAKCLSVLWQHILAA